MNRLLQICLAQGGLLTTTSDLKVHLNEYLIQEKKKKILFPLYTNVEMRIIGMIKSVMIQNLEKKIVTLSCLA